MNERNIVRAMAVRIGKPKNPQLARALNLWSDRNDEWLGLTKARDWASACAALARSSESEPQPDLLKVAGIVAKALSLDDFDTALLSVLVAVHHLPCASSLAEVCSQFGRNLPAMLGMVAGAPAVDADRAVRRSAVLQLGLVTFRMDRQGILEVDLHYALERVLERAIDNQDGVVATLIGPRQSAHLTLNDFAHIGDADFLVRLLAGAVAERASGINILIHGPAGTGKTEFARTLAHAAQLALYAIGEADADNDEPLRSERVSALQLAQRVLAPTGNAMLLFDEMEDLIGNAKPSRGDWLSEREGSKVFVNRLLETSPVPVIWTTNALGNVDPAILRRMSYVLKFDLPSPATARRILTRITAEEGVTASVELEALLHRAPETTTILRGSARAARLAGEIDGTC